MLWSRYTFFLVLCSLLAGCQIQPLYSNRNLASPSGINGDIAEQLATITIAAPRDRYTQILRNRLISLLGHGAVQEEKHVAQHRLELDVNVSVVAAVRLDIGDRTDRTGRASAGTVHARVRYTLLNDKGEVVAKRQRRVSASFDRPRQEYANLQAQEDAKTRSLEELAEQLYLSVAQDLAKNMPK